TAKSNCRASRGAAGGSKKKTQAIARVLYAKCILVKFRAVIFYRREFLQRLGKSIVDHGPLLLLHHEPLLLNICIRVGHRADILHLDKEYTGISGDSRGDRLTSEVLIEGRSDDLTFL